MIFRLDSVIVSEGTTLHTMILLQQKITIGHLLISLGNFQILKRISSTFQERAMQEFTCHILLMRS